MLDAPCIVVLQCVNYTAVKLDQKEQNLRVSVICSIGGSDKKNKQTNPIHGQGIYA
jgi:hypothetical protein